jgi:alpha-glucosidase
VPRFHNNPAISRKAEIGAAVLQFTMIGTPSIYYGDEAEIGGWTETIEGCRFPMPWSRDIESTEMYRIYHTLIRARNEHPALTDGGMTYLYADGPVIAFARLGKDEAVVTVVSSSKNEERVTLPLDLIGAEYVPGTKDVLGQTVRGESSGEGELTVTLEPEGALAFPVTYRA